jgi:hypothetical protein
MIIVIDAVEECDLENGTEIKMRQVVAGEGRRSTRWALTNTKLACVGKIVSSFVLTPTSMSEAAIVADAENTGASA